MLTHGVSLRTNLNIDSTKLAGVDSSHVSNSFTIQVCNVFMSLQFNVLIDFSFNYGNMIKSLTCIA